MFWDGTHWVDTSTSASSSASGPPSRPTGRRLRDVVATLVLPLGLVALVMPLTGTSAATYPVDELVAGWGEAYETTVVGERAGGTTYKGRWTTDRHAVHLGGSIASSWQRGARATYHFTGSAVAWVGPRRTDRGAARIYVDGSYVRTVDTSATTLLPREVLYSRTWQSVGSHTLTIEVVGTKGHPRVSVDAFVVRGEAKATVDHALPAAPAPTTGAGATPTPNAAPTLSPSPTAAPTATPIATSPPTAAPPPAATPTPAPTVTPVPAATPTPRPSATPMPAPTTTGCGTSLQARIDATAAGATLDLTGCTYTAGARVSKPLTLRGATISVSTPGATALTVTGSNVTLDELTISGASVAKYGVLAHGASALAIRGSTITDVEYAGIMAVSVTDATIAGNHVARIGTRLANGENAYGIAVSNYSGEPVSRDVTVAGNTVEDVPTWHALDTHAGVGVAFTDNIVRRSSRAVFITLGASYVTVTGNQLLSPSPVTYNLSAVTLASTDHVTISGNRWSADWAGRYVNDYGGNSTNLVVADNTVVP